MFVLLAILDRLPLHDGTAIAGVAALAPIVLVALRLLGFVLRLLLLALGVAALMLVVSPLPGDPLAPIAHALRALVTSSPR